LLSEEILHYSIFRCNYFWRSTL